MSKQQSARHNDDEVEAFRKLWPHQTESLEVLREKEGLSGHPLVVDHQQQMSDGDIDLSEEEDEVG